MATEASADDTTSIDEDATEETLASLSDEFANTRNSNARKAVLPKIASLNIKRAADFLCTVICNTSEENFIRQEAARLLPVHNAKQAIPLLSSVIANTDHNGLLQEALTSLGRFNSPESYHAMFVSLDTRNKVVKARLLIMMAEAAPYADATKSERYRSRLEDIAGTDSEERVRKSALAALAALPGNCDGFLLKRFDGETADGLRRRILELLAASNTAVALEHLIKVCATSDRPSLREAAQPLIGRFPFEQSLDAAIRFIRETTWHGALHARELSLALAGEDASRRKRLSEAAIHAAVDAPERVVSALATLLIESCGGSREKAGEQINALCATVPEHRDKYNAIRIAVGGTESLEPILEQLNRNLEENFSKPIADLNKRTIRSWERTVLYVQAGFIIQLTMSSLVFLIGMGLTIWSVIQFSKEPSSAASLWGPGASLVAGMASMVAIAYSGPIKNVQNSVDAVGRANAIFIAFVHSILQSSHVFSMRYMRGALDISDAVEINKLVHLSMSSAVAALKSSPYPPDAPFKKEADDKKPDPT